MTAERAPLVEPLPIRERILARRVALLSERANAEAAGRYEPAWTHIESAPAWKGAPLVVGRTREGGDDDIPIQYVIVQGHGANKVATTRHIATQDPAATIARVDRELAGIDADLLLLDYLAVSKSADRALRNLNARYGVE